MKLLLMLCAVAQWVLVTGNSQDDCVMGNGRYLIEDDDMDMSQLTGNWYTLYLIPKNMTEALTCPASTYELKPDGSLQFLYSLYNQSTHQRESSIAKLKQDRGRLRYDFVKKIEFNAVYYVIATDYKQFSLNGGCPADWDRSHKVVWINFRTKEPSKAALKAAEKAVQKMGLEMSDFTDACEDKSQYF